MCKCKVSITADKNLPTYKTELSGLGEQVVVGAKADFVVDTPEGMETFRSGTLHHMFENQFEDFLTIGIPLWKVA